MQIKDVCRRTGLTERAVRFYIEKELLSPEKTWRNGREYLDFSEKDLRTLDQIAGLRRRFFTLEEIRTMQTRPDRIGEVLTAYRAGLRTETQDRQGPFPWPKPSRARIFRTWPPSAAAWTRRPDAWTPLSWTSAPTSAAWTATPRRNGKPPCRSGQNRSRKGRKRCGSGMSWVRFWPFSS